MYRIGKTYKIEILNKIFYTGEVTEEDTMNIRLLTLRGENLILNKNSIVQAKEMNSIGDQNGKEPK